MSPLAHAIVSVLAEEGPGGSMSLPRLSKRLGLSVSVVLREMSVLGDAPLGGMPGPGWVHVSQHDGQWRAALTCAGYQRVAASVQSSSDAGADGGRERESNPPAARGATHRV